jgi:NADPH-dependent 2,4-dienoyl-CoA reductase/sulfur reductase-like enzyme/rhodanese-related sulfurtransferase
MNRKRLLVVGGVAGGASCAARARRLSEDADIIIFERGPFVSFANCGLPYYVGKVIDDEEDLIVASPQLFKEWFNIDVRTESNVRSINRQAMTIAVEDLRTGRIYTEPYTELVLAPGSRPLKPRLDGIDLPGIFTLWTIPDTRNIIEWITARQVTQAVVVGGGFIGLEMTENLNRIGIGVTIVEMQNQVMPALDSELASFVHEHLREKNVELLLGTAVSGFEREMERRIKVRLDNGSRLTTDMVILSVGVRPRIELAEAAGLEIGERGGIKVDARMRTSDPHIWAAGDAVQSIDFVTGLPTMVPLAGPANRQGRLAADVIFGAPDHTPQFRGTQATSVCGILGMTIASTGTTEKFLEHAGKTSAVEPYDKIYLHPDHHAAYYPDAKTITMKLIFSKENGRILGAQAIGMEGVEKRIDVIAMAIQKGGTVFDLEEAELCYAPQYGSAKDPVNIAGMIAANVLRGYCSSRHWEDIFTNAPYILDVRDTDEFEEEHIPGAVNIPLADLRKKHASLPEKKEIWTHCFVGKRSYYAARILAQKGFKIHNLSGGYRMYQAVRQAKEKE